MYKTSYFKRGGANNKKDRNRREKERGMDSDRQKNTETEGERRRKTDSEGESKREGEERDRGEIDRETKMCRGYIYSRVPLRENIYILESPSEIIYIF